MVKESQAAASKLEYSSVFRILLRCLCYPKVAVSISLSVCAPPLPVQCWREATFTSLRSHQGVLWSSAKLKSFNAACQWTNREYTLLHTGTSALLAFITSLAFMMCAVKKKREKKKQTKKLLWMEVLVCLQGLWNVEISTGPSAAPQRCCCGHQLGPGRGWNLSPSQFIH